MAKAEPQDKRNKSNIGGASKMATSMAFIVSVVVHLVIFLFVGSIVIFEGAIPPNLFTSMGGDMINEEVSDEMELPPLMEEELEPEPLETPMDELELDTEVDLSDAMTSSDLIISSATAPVMAPTFTKPLLSVGTDTGTKIVTRTNTTNRGASRGPGTPRTANIFGRTVSASNFGALLDISFSTHNTIDAAVDEIKSGFPDAILVLAPGCGIGPNRKGEVIKGKEFEKDIKDYKYDGKEELKAHYYSAAFLETLLSKNKDFEKLWQRAMRDDRGYVIHGDIGKPRTDHKGDLVIGDTGVTHLGFEFLIDQGCDVIYWMADFDDAINKQMANAIIKDLTRADVKLIQHDFNGATQNDQHTRATLKDMVNKTEGESIIGKN